MSGHVNTYMSPVERLKSGDLQSAGKLYIVFGSLIFDLAICGLAMFVTLNVFPEI